MNNRLAGRIVRFDEIVTDADFAAIFEDAKVEEAVASATLAEGPPDPWFDDTCTNGCGVDVCDWGSVNQRCPVPVPDAEDLADCE